MGIDFPHSKGKFCPKVIRNYYTVCCFSTPFVYLCDSKYLKGNEGDIIIHTPGAVVHQGPLPDAKQGFVNDWFHIDGEDFTRLIKKYPLPLDRAFSVNKPNFFRSYALRLNEELNTNEKGADDVINSIITQMVVDTFRAYEKASKKGNSISQIEKVNKLLSLNPESDWTLNKMAALSGYSVSRFSELYRKNYGISPMEDVLKQRIILAKRLLSSGQASVSYTAVNCGFSSINYFSKYFKKITGLTPREFAKQYNG